jgi:2-phospho-L-lactate guanylyltransferase
VVVPVKPLARAKSRLGAYGDATRADLALAFAEDVVAALLQCAAVAGVVVVTDDVRAARALADLGARVVPDVPGEGLNAAVVRGAQALRTRGGSARVAALPADLPAVRPEHVAAALSAVPTGGRAFVADAERQGTTLLAADGVDLAPAYGGSSRARHLATGATELPAADALRRDVDTPQDLAHARVLGLGPRTLAVMALDRGT